jgi:RNA polymerase sigma factor (sigma-70 family)
MLALKLSKKEQLNDQLLLAELKNDNYKAFTTLYECYVAEVTTYACRFTNDIQIVEDSLHDIFVYLWNNRSHLKITYSVKAYLFKSVRTSILHKMEKSKKITSLEDTYKQNNAPFYISDEERFIETESRLITKEKLKYILGFLTAKQKEVIYLRFYRDLTFDEIAIHMKLTTKACYKLMGRAMGELRKSYTQPAQPLIYFLLFFQLVG